ncbi:interleukin-1 receptor type 2 isoform X2 [Varanus komodoensis]|uniref:Interleukin 1 receptor type 2 n=1 Tax=Varanus komodoensis TaxID=61221 RepID=A0A8D2JBG3_VARKO|nr:interleukin-1 receptor type 2 isoform X2 [Varanus komodoensis]
MSMYRLQGVIHHFSLSWFLCYLVPELLYIFSINVLDTSAFRIQRAGSTDNCRDHTLHFRPTFLLTGEPVVLKCPLLRYGQTNGFDPQLNITWAKNGSAAFIPTGYRGARIFSQDEALWFLPVSLEDSGVYICTLRNSSYCSDVAIHLQVVDKSFVHALSYPQKAFISSPGKLVCPNLESFIQKDTGYALRWYKDSTPLDIDNKKFITLKNTHYLMISSVSLDDLGYYTCLMTFEHEKTTYNITRIIQLQAFGQEKETVPVIVYPNQKITLAVLGSRLTIPCKVYVGENDHSFTDVWWLVNNSYVDKTYHKGRIYEGKAQKLVENDDIYIEVPLIFDPVKEEDFNTDFTCVAQNSRGHQIHATQVKQEERHLPWYLASIPVALAAAIVGVVCIRKYWKKRRSAKGYIAAET